MALLQIGPVAFETTGPLLDKLKHHTKGWVSQKRFGRADARQWTGLMDEDVSVSATVYVDYFDGAGTAAKLRAVQSLPQMVVSGAGDVYGLWCILEVGDEQTQHDASGAPGKIALDIKLGRYGEDGWDGLGALLGQSAGVGAAIGAALAVRLF